MGNWAEITVTDGRIEMTASGAPTTSTRPAIPRPVGSRRAIGSPPATTIRARRMARPLRRLQPDSGPDGTTDLAVWKNINMSPDMATTGRAIADLYPQSGGSELDGVFMMDVYTLARLLQFTGPIELPDGQVVDGRRTVTADTAADFLLKGQYDITSYDERVDVLEEFSHRVIDRLLGGPLPAPVDLLDALGPMAEQGGSPDGPHARPNRTSSTEFGLGGTLPDRPVGDAVAIAFNNAAGSKIDYYLTAEARLHGHRRRRHQHGDRRPRRVAHQCGPEQRRADYVIGNLIGLPDGYNRTWVSIFSKLPVHRRPPRRRARRGRDRHGGRATS
jgi:hypothetical protein